MIKYFNNLPWIEKEEKIAEKKCAKIQTQIVKTSVALPLAPLPPGMDPGINFFPSSAPFRLNRDAASIYLTFYACYQEWLP